MNKLFLFFSFFCFSTASLAAVHKVHLPEAQVKLASNTKANFTQLSFDGFSLSNEVGAPELPVKIWLVQGTPEQVQIQIKTLSARVLKNTRPFPVQPQACRCDDDKKIKFAYDVTTYKETQPSYRLNYLGSFRGVPITQVQVNLSQYNWQRNEVVLLNDVEVNLNLPEYSFKAADYRDYLMIVPENLVSGVQEFVDWKKSQGFNVLVETILTPANTLSAISSLIAKHYQESGTDFVIIVGDEKTIPMYKVKTSGSSQTPTDLKYFTMDGADDYVPDMFASRIVASTAEEVRAILSKSIEFSQKASRNSDGWKKFIGIASNEGSNPSDNDYVLGIDAKIKSTLQNTSSTHLFQNDTVHSNPAGLNDAFKQGAFWMTYVGHGSGTSWPSMYRSYSTADIKNMNNAESVKPVIIDVACMNGNLNKSMLGVSLMGSQSSSGPTGAAAYYGGTVNISWHPPAIMAQGIVFEHMDKKFKYLGETLIAGQLYLASKWTKKEEVIDNMEWYHLQGDPGMSVEF